MTRKVEVQLLDDIDGSPAEETVTFGLDGKVYEIDLSARRADKLRTELQRFISAARRIRPAAAVGQRRVGAVRSTVTDRAQNQAIRAWAKRKRIKLSDRGRIPKNVVERFEAEAGR